MSYKYDVLRYLEAKGMRSFTHKDIAQATNANCSYTVLQNLKKELIKEGKDITRVEERRTREVYDPDKKKNVKITKRFMRYFIVTKEKTA